MSSGVSVRLCCAMNSWLLDESENSAQRNTDPIRAVIQFVGDFVESLVQEKCVEKKFSFLSPGREKGGISGRFKIAPEIGGTDPRIPKSRPRLDGFRPFGLQREPGNLAEQRGICGVLERADHPC